MKSPILTTSEPSKWWARLGSVRAAAEEISLTHAALSRRVKRLSVAIGEPLFKKKGRGLQLTDAGHRMQEACRRCFDDLDRVITEIRQTNAPDNDAVLLSCERSVAMRWLIPRLSQFQDSHPDVEVHLSVGGGAVDAGSERPTLALRRLDFKLTNDWTVMPLFDEAVGPVMTSDQLNRFESGDYVALASTTRPAAWDDWLTMHPDAPRPASRSHFDHHFLSMEAASSGLGVAMAPQVLAGDDIERGRLIAPMGFAPDGSAYGILHPAGIPLSSNTQALLDWLLGLVREKSV